MHFPRLVGVCVCVFCLLCFELSLAQWISTARSDVISWQGVPLRICAKDSGRKIGFAPTAFVWYCRVIVGFLKSLIVSKGHLFCVVILSAYDNFGRVVTVTVTGLFFARSIQKNKILRNVASPPGSALLESHFLSEKLFLGLEPHAGCLVGY